MAKGKANKLVFKDAEEARDAITIEQEKEIAKLYDEWADEIGEKAKYYSKKTTASSSIQERQMKELQKQIKETGKQVSNKVYGKIKENVYTVADAVVSSSAKWMKELGFSEDGINASYISVPDKIVRKVVTGQIYKSGWGLSNRIWGDNEATMKDIYRIVARGMAENKSIADISKDLEDYVRPSVKKPWNHKIAMRNNKTGKMEYARIHKRKVDYNAQRLARTLVQHGYQQAFIEVTENNPFVLAYMWDANGSRPCLLCTSRNGQVFNKGELPMDHPNGMCTMVPVIDDDMPNKLIKWMNEPDGTYPDIDKFAKSFGYSNPASLLPKSSAQKFNSWYASLDDEQKAIAKKAKEESGMTWQEWYDKNIKVEKKPKATTKVTTKKTATKKQTTNTKISKASTTKSANKAKTTSKAKSSTKVPTSTTSNNPSTTATKPVPSAKAPSPMAQSEKDAWDRARRSNSHYEYNKYTDDWLDKLTDEERRAVQTYTGSAYESMNKYLRGQSGYTGYEQEIKDCAKALSKASLPKDTYVTRGSDYNMLDALGVKYSADDKSKIIGQVVTDKGFTSTSIDPNSGFDKDIQYVIKVPKGSQAMYVSSISAYSSEQELLINKGAKFEIKDVEFGSDGKVKKIYMELKNLQSGK